MSASLDTPCAQGSPAHAGGDRRPRPRPPTHPRERPIRVCFLLDRLLPAGTEMQVLSLIGHLDRRVIQPYLCLLDGADPLSRSLEPADCPVLRLGVFAIRSPRGILGAWRFARFLRRERIDILQVYFIQSATFGALIGRLAGVRHVLRVRNNIGHWVNARMHGRFRWVNRLVTAILTNSQAGRQAVIDQERVAAESVVVVENGVDFARFPSRPDPERFHRRGIKRVGIVANLRRVKGLDVFLEAAARVVALDPDVTFLVAGGEDGEDLRGELDRQAAALGLSGRVEFLGRLADVAAFLQTLDVAILSSRAEGTSNALIEYMAAGLPIVATAVGGNLALIRDEVDGLLVPPDDPDRLGAAITRLLHDPEAAARLAVAAHAAVRARFAAGAPARDYEQLYRDLADPHE
jgi:glycosyltransferase involved in cell wall biosynthesis